MATSTLTVSAASALVSNTRAAALRSPVSDGLSPRSVVPTMPSWKAHSSRASGLVVKAQQGGSPMKREPITAAEYHKKVALLETSPYVRTPWNTSEDEHDIRIWFDMPGLAAENIDVNVVDDLLVIKGEGGIDAFGNKIFSPYESSVQLPIYSWKEEITAVFKNGVLYINVPKITKFEHKIIHVPVRSI